MSHYAWTPNNPAYISVIMYRLQSQKTWVQSHTPLSTGYVTLGKIVNAHSLSFLFCGMGTTGTGLLQELNILKTVPSAH